MQNLLAIMLIRHVFQVVKILWQAYGTEFYENKIIGVHLFNNNIDNSLLGAGQMGLFVYIFLGRDLSCDSHTLLGV